jgi:hypothetical protein
MVGHGERAFGNKQAALAAEIDDAVGQADFHSAAGYQHGCFCFADRWQAGDRCEFRSRCIDFELHRLVRQRHVGLTQGFERQV